MASAKRQSLLLKKVIDAETPVRCATGDGFIREETWEDEAGNVVRFNLAFINPWLTVKDNGRVLGYDTAHGYLHRHFAGEVSSIESVAYDVVLTRFLKEVTQLRRAKEL